MLIARFAPDGPILLAGDDTLCRKRGLGWFGVGRHHDPLCSSKALKVLSRGHDWVVLALLRPWYRRKQEPSFEDMLTTVIAPRGPHAEQLATVAEWAARVGGADRQRPPGPGKPPND